jgi:methionyl-tRNA formyltransferase
VTAAGGPPPLAAPPVHPRRLVYLGTPAMAVPPLRALHAAGHDIALVVTRPDKRRGRGSALAPSPVKAAARELGLPVTDRVDDALDVGADLGVVVAFGRIIRRPVLERLPMINLHFSLLPRWRGAAPVERALLAGDACTGVDVMAVEEGLDTGGIYAEGTLDIGPDETADELRNRLVALGTDLLVRTLADGLGELRPQVGEPVYAEKIDPAELALDWTRPAVELHRLVRLGGAWTTFRGKRFKVWRTVVDDGDEAGGTPAPGELAGDRVGTGDGVLRLIEVQPEGRARQSAVDWRNGARPTPGESLGAAAPADR